MKKKNGEKIMIDRLVDSLKRETNYVKTENGGNAHKTTLNAVYDLFALGGAYRSRTDDDCKLLFKKALDENQELALKCLFYLRDIKGGQGERRFFRVCYNWLAKEHPELAFRNLDNIPEYGRWDDLYSVVGTSIEQDAFDVFQCQLNKDLASLKAGDKEGVSLLGKWLKSENASAKETKWLANKTREYLGYSHKKYRKILSALRTRINIVEKLMSEGKWEEICFEKLPSRAGFIYRNAFAHNDLIKDKYEEFINSKETKVNAGTLYPYDIVYKAIHAYVDETERNVLNKYWENQIDYLNGEPCRILCVVDTSGSMCWSGYNNGARPIDVAISLGMYCGERIGGAFHNKYISFSSRPQLIDIDGIDFYQKVQGIYGTNLCENTNLTAVFDLLLDVAVKNNLTEAEMPESIVVISDMEIDSGSYWNSETERNTEMDKIRSRWAEAGRKMPKLVYWNVSARDNLILDDAENENVTFVSGCSPVIFESIVKGKSGKQVMLDKLQSDRYKNIK